MRFVRFSFYKTVNYTASCGAVCVVHCYLRCCAVWLGHFAGGFGVVFVVCIVYAVC